MAVLEADGGLTVALDTHLTEALVAEGNAREFVNRVQNLRKDAGFQVTDRIGIVVSGGALKAMPIPSLCRWVMRPSVCRQISFAVVL